jgi:hypothetical protein
LLDGISSLAQTPDMDADEREIYDFLKSFGEEWVNAKEICRRAGGKRRFGEDPHWARPALQRMKDRKVLEMDMSGRFRIKPEDKKGHKGRWVSPEIEKALRESGVQVDAERAGAIDENIEPD